MMQRLTLALVWLLFGAGMAQTAPAPTARPAPTAHIVVQSSESYVFEVAAWMPDSRFLFTANGSSRELLLWDVERSVMVDRLILPGYPKELYNSARYQALRLAPDGKTLLVEGVSWTNDLQKAPLVIRIDINSRTATLVDTPFRLLPSAEAEARYRQDSVAAHSLRILDAHRAARRPEAPDAADVQVPILPDSPDGHWRIIRDYPYFKLRGRNGEERDFIPDAPKGSVMSAATSPNGQVLALSIFDTWARHVVELHDLLTGRLKRRLVLHHTSDFIGWADDGRFLGTADSPRPADETPGNPATINVIDAETGQVVGSLPSACKLAIIPFGFVVANPPGHCKTRPDAADYKSRVLRFRNDRWEPMSLPVSQEILDAGMIMKIEPSRRGEKLAVLIMTPERGLVVPVLNRDGGDGVVLKLPPIDHTNRTELGDGIGFSPDASSLLVAREGIAYEWQLGDEAARKIITDVQIPGPIASNGQQWLVSGYDGRLALIDAGTSKARLELNFSTGISAVGFLPDRPIMWAASPEGLRMWDSRTGAELFTTYYLGEGFVTVAPDGRYDTNLGPDSRAFRWLLPKSPFQSLAPQTFMRDYFEPELARKLIDCSTAGSCAQRLRPVRALANINTLLPQVEITRITPAGPGEADVEIAITEQVTKGGKRSGAYRASLMINNREVARNPGLNLWENARSLKEWRREGILDGNRQGRRTLWRARVEVPTDGKPMEFSAYAFNSDRVKSDTVRALFTPPPTLPRPRRAFVVTIGVDHYAEPRLALNFAVSDARVIAGRLAQIPGFEMRHASLTTGIDPDGKQRSVDYYDLRRVFNRLSGNRETSGVLTETRHDLSALDRATPDDIVIISYSGHGYTDPTGDFALLTSETHWPASASAPDPLSIFSSKNLYTWLRNINAGEFTLIIDACHSGALVSQPDFKPGPMGDNGLAQTAYDKGIRILAATQADDVALESSLLRQGFLTATLGEGLTDDGGPADLNEDDRITLDEWLRYAVARLPSLEAEVRRGGGINLARGVRLVMRSTSPQRKVQEPSLFDFNSAPSPVVLRGRPSP